MKNTLLAFAVLAVLCTAAPARASLTADLKVSEKETHGVKGTRLWAEVYLSGIADCPTTGSVTIVFTSPDEKTSVSSEFEVPWKSCSKYDDDENPGHAGTARTWAFRTVRFKGHTVVGVWKVTVKAGDTVLASSEYKVE